MEISKKSTPCANLRVLGCTELVTQKGNILCIKCLGNRASLFHNKNNDDNVHQKIEERRILQEKIKILLQEKDRMIQDYEYEIKNINMQKDEDIKQLTVQLKLIQLKNEDLLLVNSEHELKREEFLQSIKEQEDTNKKLSQLNGELINENKKLNVVKNELLELNQKLTVENQRVHATLNNIPNNSEEIIESLKQENEKLLIQNKELMSIVESATTSLTQTSSLSSQPETPDRHEAHTVVCHEAHTAGRREDHTSGRRDVSEHIETPRKSQKRPTIILTESKEVKRHEIQSEKRVSEFKKAVEKGIVKKDEQKKSSSTSGGKW